jgi:hypothetical protein
MTEFVSHVKNGTSFVDIASPLIKLGIAVVPTQPGLRYPSSSIGPNLPPRTHSKYNSGGGRIRSTTVAALPRMAE